jgi:3-polyprenyl-4-hydroxybenzoate decarboxylase
VDVLAATVADVVDHIVTRALDQIGVEPPSKTRWSGRPC